MPRRLARRIPISPVNAGFVIGTLALIVIGSQALIGAAQLRSQSSWVTHTFRVLGLLDQVDDVSRLAARDTVARQIVDAGLIRLRSILTSPEQVSRVDSLERLTAAGDWNLRPLIARMRFQEQRLLAEREDRVEATTNHARSVITLTIVLAVGLMSAALVLLRDDLRRRRSVEGALRESEAKYRLLMEQAADAILIVDHAAVCLDGNERAAQIMGRPREEIPGVPMRAFVRREDSTGFVLPMLRFGHVTTGEFLVERPDGSHVPVEIRATLLEDGRVQVIARDISERREVERAKDEFVSVVSHELRSPLTSIRGALGLIAAGKLENDPVRRQRMLDVAMSNTDRLIRLIADILDIERMSAGETRFEFEEVNASDLVHSAIDALRMTADRGGVTLRTDLREVRVRADSDRLTQTLTNLIDNAIKFSPAGTAVTVRVRRDGTFAQFTIQDQGRGIPREMHERIFGRFQQVDASDAREKGGTGLGLAISRSIVERHGGRIWVESEAGQGATFCFTIPLYEASSSAGAA